MSRARTYRTPIVVVGLALVVSAFLGLAGVDVLMVALVASGALAWRINRRERSMLIADYVERSSFPSDTVKDFVENESGTTLEEARRRLESWRRGYAEAEHQARERRSAAARRAAATRRCTKP